MMDKTKSIFGILLIVLAIFLAGCSGTASTPIPTPTESPMLDAVSLKLSWQHGVQFLGYYVAQEQGYYQEENLSVTIDAISEPAEVFELVTKVTEGDYDFSMNTTPLIQDLVNGTPVTAIATILQLSPQSFFTRAELDIHTPKDFAGHRVAVTAESTRVTLGQLLNNFGLTLNDVEIIQSNFDMTPFLEGEVDIWVGYLTNEVVRARQAGLELVTFPSYEYGVRSTEDMLFTRREMVEDNPDLAVRFLRATIRGWHWAIENPEQAVDIMLKMYPEMSDERDFHLASFNAYIPLIQIPGRPIGSINCEAWLNNALFTEVNSTDGFCTTEIFEQSTKEN